MLLRSSSTPTLETWIPRRYKPMMSFTGSRSPIQKIQRTSSESNMRQISISTRQQKPYSNLMGSPRSVVQSTTQSVVVGGGENGGNVGCKGRREKFREWDERKQSMDEFYQKMIKTYPEDALFLTNYARFLKEVRGNFQKAEEYCERAILMNPDDGEVLAMYAELIQINHEDEERSQFYFDQAVEASPENCYVLGSYALNIWNSEK